MIPHYIYHTYSSTHITYNTYCTPWVVSESVLQNNSVFWKNGWLSWKREFNSTRGPESSCIKTFARIKISAAPAIHQTCLVFGSSIRHFVILLSGLGIHELFQSQISNLGYQLRITNMIVIADNRSRITDHESVISYHD